MKKLALTVAAASAFAMLSNAAYAQCTIFPKIFYKGTPEVIKPGEIALFSKEHYDKYVAEMGNKPVNGVKITFKPAFNNSLNASMSTDSCSLVTYDRLGDKGKKIYPGNQPKFDYQGVMAAACVCN
jgi:hypothetical protein